MVSDEVGGIPRSSRAWPRMERKAKGHEGESACVRGLRGVGWG